MLKNRNTFCGDTRFAYVPTFRRRGWWKYQLHLHESLGIVVVRTRRTSARVSPISFLSCVQPSQAWLLRSGHIRAHLFSLLQNGCCVRLSAISPQQTSFPPHCLFFPTAFVFAQNAKLLFPVLMVAMVWRTIAVRVRPNDLLVFRLHGSEGEEGGEYLQHGMGKQDGQGAPQPQAEDRGVPQAADDGVPGAETGRSQPGLWQKVCSFKSPRVFLIS